MEEQKSRKPRHYIVVVHGIGEQKQNTTAPEVVHRFAEVRKEKPAGYYRNLLPSYLSAQSVRRGGMGHGWSEFNGIPIDLQDPTGDFDGTPGTDTSGRNFRFVDLHWQHILQRHQERYASPTEKWAPALLERISEEKGMVPEGWIPKWATPLLHSLVDTVLPVKKLLSFRYPDLAKRIFDDFLGDIHLYGDYARTRGRAVRHFHVILDEIHLRDFIDWCHRDKDQGENNPYQPPIYTIIAHSLGTIMSFDALVYAHAKEDVRKAKASSNHPCPSLPFLGYTFDRQVEKDSWSYLMRQLGDTQRRHELISLYPQVTDAPEIPPLMWRDCVKTFITLGSPIDKYHVMWFQNYLHMGLRRKDDKPAGGHRTFAEFTEDWAKGWLDRPQRKGTIVHYNLCDEQDPVGHHLDVAEASVNYKNVFDTKIPVTYRDIVFRRYAVPGVAHVKYWEDGDLFKGIVTEVIDGEKADKEPDPDLTEYEKQKGLSGSYFLRRNFWNRKGVYEKTLQWAYFRVPFLASLVTGGLLSYGSYPLYAGKIENIGVFHVGVLLAGILLWTCPRPAEEYALEAQPEQAQLETEGAALKQRWKFRRGILAHLVAGMVEWRRVLIMLSEGESTDRETCLKAKMHLALKAAGEKAGQFSKGAKKRYVVCTVILVVSAFLACPYLTKLALDIFPDVVQSKIQLAGIIGMILSLCYLLTRLYVGRVYREAKKRVEQTAG